MDPWLGQIPAEAISDVCSDIDHRDQLKTLRFQCYGKRKRQRHNGLNVHTNILYLEKERLVWQWC